MCRSMVDIQSATAEIRRGIKKREDRNHRANIIRILLRKAAINSNISPTYSYILQYDELWPNNSAEIDSLVRGTLANFHGFRVLAASLHGTLVVGVSQTLRR